jgi:hypothetical protein
MRLVAAILLLAAGLPGSAGAQTPAQVCARLGTDDTTRPVPASLVPAVNRLFGIQMPEQVAVATTVYRCMDGQVLVCTTGANLPCGKANTSRTSAGAEGWCGSNPNADYVPAYATGHDTIYQWRCRGGSPDIVRQTGAVDPRGFVATYWKRLE